MKRNFNLILPGIFVFFLIFCITLMIISCGCSREEYPDFSFVGEDSIFRIPEEIWKNYPSARERYIAGDYSASLSELSDMVRPGESPRELLLLIAECANRSGNMEGAAAQYDSIIRQYPQWIPALWGRLLLAYRMSDYSTVLDCANKIIKENPKNISARTYRAQAYSFLQKYHRAIWEYKKLVRIMPENDTLLTGLGEAYIGTGDFKKAEEIFKKSAELNPYSTVTKQALGILYAFTGRFTDAIELLEVVRKNHPDAYLVHNILSDSYAFIQQYDKAEEIFKETLEKVPGNEYEEACTYVHYSMFLIKRYRWAEAEAYLKRAKKITPAVMTWNGNMGIVLYQTGRIKESEKYFKKAVIEAETDPETKSALVPVYAGYARLLLEEGRLSEAEEFMNDTLKKLPWHWEIYALLSRKKLNDGDLEKAGEFAKMSVELGPEDIVGDIALGDVALARGDVRDAVRHYQSALEKGPEEADAYLAMGKALEITGEKESALRHYKKAYRLNPFLYPAVYREAKILEEKGYPEGAGKLLVRAGRTLPKDPQDRRFLASSYACWGYDKSAMDILRPILSIPGLKKKALKNPYLGPLVDKKY
ncbi:MAG: tetratricopeptide repeat protein [Candidatus Eremiobacteraeota bacterium]|nr:tetratricopeptide repeat protein [Candidatus Eremiobacteraeota bacterium]